MFTGLIESVCTAKSARRSADGLKLTVDLGKLADEAKIGDSIAINGVCLTVTKLQGSLADFDVSSETLKKSTLEKLKPSQQVNIELALKSGGRFGGHFVQGHVDGIATIKTVEKQGQFANFTFQADSQLLEQMVVKGSVAIDGISLTITGLNKDSFGSAIIPETLNKTTLGSAKIGDQVNIETDIIIKAVKKQLENILPKKQKLTAEKLKELGF
ncbi:MAG: riboflavin synthase [Planctomycetes bacterium]|nr:riboflavin synthase [Planctomycetota bacterium]